MEQADMRDLNPRAERRESSILSGDTNFLFSEMCEYTGLVRGRLWGTERTRRPHSLVEERRVLNSLAGVRFSLRPPSLALSSSD